MRNGDGAENFAADDPLRSRTADDLQPRGGYSPGMAAAWFVGIALFIGVLIHAIGGEDEKFATVPPPPCEAVEVGNGYYQFPQGISCGTPKGYAEGISALAAKHPNHRLEHVGRSMFFLRPK